MPPSPHLVIFLSALCAAFRCLRGCVHQQVLRWEIKKRAAKEIRPMAKASAHLHAQVPRDDIVGPARLHLAIGSDRVHGQGRQRRGRLGDQDDNHGQEDARLPDDKGETDKQNDAQDVLHARLEYPLDRAELALRGLLPRLPL